MKTKILFNPNPENFKNSSVYKVSLFNSNSETGFATGFHKLQFLFNSHTENFKNPSVYKASLFDWLSESQF